MCGQRDHVEVKQIPGATTFLEAGNPLSGFEEGRCGI